MYLDEGSEIHSFFCLVKDPLNKRCILGYHVIPETSQLSDKIEETAKRSENLQELLQSMKGLNEEAAQVVDRIQNLILCL